MIQLHLTKDTAKFAGAVFVFFGLLSVMYFAGIHVGSTLAQRHHDAEVAEYVIAEDQLNKQLIDSQLQLTQCEAVKAGQCALNCESIAQERVDSVLQDLQEVMCGD
jgi:hypothetical protein